MAPSSFDSLPESFSGQASLFPLPNVTLLPHAILPLHIFEPRYRKMTEDVLAGEGYFALARILPGKELGEPAPIYEQVCLAEIIADERLPDGRFYLIAQGLMRARVLSEEKTDLPYRVARLELLPDVSRSLPLINRENRRRELLEAFRDLGSRPELDKLLHETGIPGVPLGQFCDLLAASVELPAEKMQALLAEPDVDLRSDLLLNGLRELRREARSGSRKTTFPPDFSVN